MSDIKLTALEQRAYNAIVEITADDYSASAKDVAKKIKEPVQTIKGAIGSLAKKGVIICETEERGGVIFHDVRPNESGGRSAYWECDGGFTFADFPLYKK